MIKKIFFYALLVVLMLGATLLGLEILIRMGIMPNMPYYNSEGWWKETYFRGHELYFTDKSLAKYSPILGWDLRENIDNLQVSDITNFTVNTNNLGLRGKRPTFLEKLKLKRAIVMGDSMTFGQCVDDDQAYPAVLDQLRSDYEVLNLGVPAYGFNQQFLKLKTFGVQLHPDVVIQSFFMPDMERDAVTFRAYSKPKFVIKNGKIGIINVPVVEPHQFHHWWDLRLMDYWQILYDQAHFKIYIKEELLKMVWIMGQIISTAHEAGAKVVLVYLPMNENLLDGQPISFLFTKICEDPSIICVDPSDKLKEYLMTVPHPEDELKCHYSPPLQKIVAQEVSKVLP